MAKHRNKKHGRASGGPGGSSRHAAGGTEILFGRQPVREMLRAGRRRVETFYLTRTTADRDDQREVLALLKEKQITVRYTDADKLDAITHGGHHQGVAAAVSPFRYVSYKKCLSDADSRKDALFLFLDHLQDPQNVGSLLRTAEGCGVCGVVIPEHRAVGITPAVVRASAGAAEHIPVAQVPNIVRCMRLLKDRGVWFAGLDAGEDAIEICEQDLTGPLGLVIGSEGRGMRRLTRETCDYVVRLPMQGRVSSFNASVAGAMALYEVLRQRASLTPQETAS